MTVQFKILIFVGLLFGSFISLADESGVRFRKISQSDNLSKGAVRDIIKDNHGYMWFATTNGLSRYDGYNFVNFKHNPADKYSLSSNNITALHLDKQNQLWVGTRDNGLNLYQESAFPFLRIPVNGLIHSISSNSEQLLVVTETKLLSLTQSVEAEKSINTQKLVASPQYTVHSFNTPLLNSPQYIVKMNEHQFLIATKNHLIKYDSNRGSMNESEFSKLLSFDQPLRIREIINPDRDNFLMATDKGVLRFNLVKLTISQESEKLIDKNVLAINYAKNGLWASVFNEGIININPNNGATITNHKEDIKNPHSLSYNTSTSLFSEDSGGLWVGGFSNGVSQLPYFNTSFELYNHYLKLLSCLTSRRINNVFLKGNELFLATEGGLFVVNIDSKKCRRADSLTNNNVAFYSFHPDSRESVVVGSNLGLFELKVEDNIEQLKPFVGSPKKSIYFVHTYSSNELLLGTYDGLYLYNVASKQSELIKHSTILERLAIYAVTQGEGGEFYFASNQGALTLTSDLELQRLSAAKNNSLVEQGSLIEQGQLTEQEKLASHSSYNSSFKQNVLQQHFNSVTLNRDHLWFGSESGHIIKFSLKEKHYQIIPLPKEDVKILSIIFDNENNLWIGSDSGLFELNTKTNRFQWFQESDGLQGDVFIRGSVFKSNDGKLFFGGRNGFNAFYPKDTKLNTSPPQVVLTKLTRFNKEVIPGQDDQGFSINKPIEYIHELELSYKDYMIGFEFAGLHFADPSRNQYAYMLEGLHNEWSYTDAQHRTETFTNLAPGRYVFRVKVASKDGVWSLKEDNVALSIIVHPAPWLTWWAFTFYGLTIVASVLFLIKYRTQAAVQRADTLELKVQDRTRKVIAQKHLIEGLLERKNELFANISHEFRTPLTLILGPLEKELQTLDSPKNVKHLSMMYRNASRLLGMVEQILKLTELKKEEAQVKMPCAVNAVLLNIVESFQPLAESKQIILNTQLDQDGTILSSQDGLEVMVGNLISNAIKYTSNGGTVSVSTWVEDNNNQLTITVADTGCGMTQVQQDAIFGRFVRLNQTSDIAGTGIGLSIVQELIKNHGGKIKVISEPQVGSRFSLVLPTTVQQAAGEGRLIRTVKSIEHLIQAENLLDITSDDLADSTDSIEFKEMTERNYTAGYQSQETVLIIDDNADMRQYIQNSLQHLYRCLTASRGEAGLKLAIKDVPDLILCDVMMPGIDGYEVAKQLRNNLITSHIPLVLLTAKGDKQSRIHGWQKNIDDYMTKPFDEVELIARIKNILSIRQILKAKVVEQFNLPSMAAADTTKAISKRFNLDDVKLNSLDKQFVRKLVQEIKLNYSDKTYTSTHMASALFMSSRQLQRKLNALVGKSPMAVLRQYRLTKASEFLLEGKPVGSVANICGFRSQSYFSQCFKDEFGQTPKQYK